MSFETPAAAVPVVAPRPVPPWLTPRAVVVATFFAFAIGIGLWAGSIPAVMRQAGLEVQGLGLGLTLNTIAYIAAMTGAGQLARHVPPRRLMRWTLLAFAPCFGLLFFARSPLVLMGALVAIGIVTGALDLAMNTEGTAVERELGRPVLLGMHAAASASVAVGALAGSMIATRGGPPWCALVVLLVTLPVAWAVHRLGPRAHPALPAPAASARGGAQRGVVGLGIVLGLTITAELTAQMWSARFLERQAADLAAYAGAGAAFFAGCQAAMRWTGDWVRRHFDDVRVISVSLAVATAGLLTVAASSWFVQSLIGFALVGLGTACVVPCCFALIARRAHERTAAALGFASLVAGAIRMPTPLLMGFVVATWSESHAFAGIAVGLVVALWLVRSAARG